MTTTSLLRPLTVCVSAMTLCCAIVMSAHAVQPSMALSSPTKQAPIVPQAMAVAAPDSYSSDVAMDILQRGGNAIDAAIAVQFVLAVTLPEAGNIGGGGFMVIHTDQGNDFIDYRETAPKAAFRDMNLDAKGDVERLKSLYGVLASGTPGTVAGMAKAHELHGSMPWADLV